MMDLLYLPVVNVGVASATMSSRSRYGRSTGDSLDGGGGDASPGGDTRSGGPEAGRKVGVAADGRRNDGERAPAGASLSVCDYSPKLSHQRSHPPHDLFTFHCFPTSKGPCPLLTPTCFLLTPRVFLILAARDRRQDINATLGFMAPCFFHLSFPETRTLFRGSRSLRLLPLVVLSACVNLEGPPFCSTPIQEQPQPFIALIFLTPACFSSVFFPPDIKHIPFKKPVAR